MKTFNIPAIDDYIKTADLVDIKTIEGESTFRAFVARMIGHQPLWVTLMYGVRMIFVRFLGMKQAGIPLPPHYTPESVPMKAGEKAYFFTVVSAEDDRYWLVTLKDTHLDASLAVVREPLTGVRSRFYVITIVHHHNWKGPVYFNVIRPFHHLVVGGMTRAGAGR